MCANEFTVVKVKICGLTSADEAVAIANLGADAIGLVFYQPSSRFVSLERAREIISVLPPFVQSVALFVNPSMQEVETVINAMPIDLLQFHGSESAEFCQQFQRPYIKAFAMREDFDVQAAMLEHVKAKGFLLDAYHPQKPGGTGESFDWQRFPQQTEKSLILAGGLTAENVAKAINQCRPYAVDVSGGVEASAGKKSLEKVAQFIQQAKSC